MPKPTIASFTPTHGVVGASVQINGTYFTGTSKVTFNGVNAPYTVTSSTKIQTTVPSSTATGRIKVTTPGGIATSATNFTVEASAMPVISRVQQVIATSETYVATLDATLPNPMTPGNALIVGVALIELAGGPTYPSPAVGSVTDNHGNVYTRDAHGLEVSDNPNNQRTAIFSTAGIGSGSVTVTYTPPVSDPSNTMLVVSEYSGMALTDIVDASASGGSAVGSTNPDSGTTQPTDKVGGLAVATCASGFSEVALAPVAPFQVVASVFGVSTMVSVMADLLINAAGAYQCLFTQGDTYPWDACIAIYRPRPAEGYLMGADAIAARYPQDLET